MFRFSDLRKYFDWSLPMNCSRLLGCALVVSSCDILFSVKTCVWRRPFCAFRSGQSTADFREKPREAELDQFVETLLFIDELRELRHAFAREQVEQVAGLEVERRNAGLDLAREVCFEGRVQQKENGWSAHRCS